MDNFNSGLYISGDGLFDFAAASAKLLRPDGECSGRDEAALLRRSMAAIRALPQPHFPPLRREKLRSRRV